MESMTRLTTPQDLAAVAQTHGAQLRHGLFPELGPGFLRAYHRSYLDSPHSLSYVAVLEERVVGFVAGTIDQHGHQRWVLRRHGVRLAWWGLLGLAVRPRTLWWFLRTRAGRYLRAVARAIANRDPRGASAEAATDEAGHTPGNARVGPTGVLTHVAVDSDARGRGLGKELTQRFAAAACERGSSEVRLVTRAEGGAAGFYEALGWEVTDERLRDGTAMMEYRFRSPDSGVTEGGSER
jgi:ribosomal protein S18 acetylase RimI-like enzyme